MKKILYISYDGLTDPLGQSQILPYLLGLEKYGFIFFILSFEKKDRLQKNRALINSLIEGKNITWVPLSFTTQPPVLSKFYDAVRMKTKAEALHRKENFAMVHCRSYIAADVGLFLKKRFGIKFFFDMRGFWADEKKDGGSWNMNNPIFRNVYKYYKRKERAYLQNADYIISLTNAGQREISTWAYYNKHIPLKVIPCCADMELFSVTDHNQKLKSRQRLGIDSEILLFSYLGSIGTWYMLKEMLLFFKRTKEVYKEAKFLFITHSPAAVILSQASELGILSGDLIVKEADRWQVPEFIKASDINISFIKPVYSKISSSPTKLGEVLSMGIPVICNSGVGDIKEIVELAEAGFVLQGFQNEDFDIAIKVIPELLKKTPSEIRGKITDTYSLEKGIEYYKASYNQLFNGS